MATPDSPARREQIWIRRATPNDVDALISIGRRSYADHYSDIWTEPGLKRYLDTQFEPRRVANELQGDASIWFLLGQARTALGFAKLNADRPVPCDQSLRGLELEKVYVLDSATRRGLGRLALDETLRTAGRIGARRIWLDVLKSNTAARRLYEREGYRVIGDAEFATDRDEIGFWVMARDL